MTGHLAMLQTWTAWSPRPIWSPIDSASGPETTSMRSTSATSTMATSVIRSMTGRSFQKGRPSPIS